MNKISVKLPYVYRINFNKGINRMLLLIIVILLAFSGTLMYGRINGNNFPSLKIYYLCMAFCLGSVLLWTREILLRSVIPPLILCFYMALHAVLSDTSTGDYAKKILIPYFCCLIFATELIEHKKTKQLMLAFSDLHCVIAAVSIFFWFFGSILDILPGRQAATYYWAEHDLRTFNYFYLYFENPIQAMEVGTKMIPRNTGIFMESPGYSAALAIALTIELLVRKQKSNLRITLLVATLITTLSTKGILFLLELAVLLWFFKMKEKRQLSLKKLIYVFILLCIAGIAIGIFLKLMNEKSDSGSYKIRMDDVQATLNTFLSRPLFGVGYNNTEPILARMRVARSNDGLSMGLLILLAQGGIHMLLFYLGAFILFYRRMVGNGLKKEAVITGVVLFTDLLISNHQFSARYIMIVSLGYAYGLQKMIKR